MAGKAMQTGAYVHKVTHAVMQHMSSDAQGVLAVADMRAFLDSAVIDGDSDERTMVAAFWQVRDPGNAGTVIRSADAAGCSAGGGGRRLRGHLQSEGDPFHCRIAVPSSGRPWERTSISMVRTHELAVYAADVYGTDSRQPESLTDVIAAPQSLAGPRRCCLAMRRVD